MFLTFSFFLFKHLIFYYKCMKNILIMQIILHIFFDFYLNLLLNTMQSLVLQIVQRNFQQNHNDINHYSIRHLPVIFWTQPYQLGIIEGLIFVKFEVGICFLCFPHTKNDFHGIILSTLLQFLFYLDMQQNVHHLFLSILLIIILKLQWHILFLTCQY